jgi:hypothetical protein
MGGYLSNKKGPRRPLDHAPPFAQVGHPPAAVRLDTRISDKFCTDVPFLRRVLLISIAAAKVKQNAAAMRRRNFKHAFEIGGSGKTAAAGF